jgi:hypothetical protein
MQSVLETRANYEPRAQVSPSRFKLAEICERADAFRYVLGIREREFAWQKIKDIPRPPADHDKKDKAAAKAHRALVSAWNRMRRGPLGKECHKIVEAWYLSFVSPQHPQIDQSVWHTEPGRIVLACLHLLPHPSTLGWWATEQKIPDSFVWDITGGAHDYEFNAYIDLLATLSGVTKPPNGWQRVADLKTTSSFDWMLTPSQLLDDPQGIVYPLYAMHRTGIDSIVGRWLYTRTEDAPSAKAVDFRVTYDGAKKRALKLFDRGAVLVQRCVDRVDPSDVTGNVAACLDFFHRTCVYHHSVGGPCSAESSPGKRLRASLATPNRREKIMAGFKKNAAAAKAAEGGAASTGEQESPEAQEGAEGGAESGEGAVDPTAEQQAAAGGGGFRGGATRGRKTKTPTEGVGNITVTFEGGASFEVPQGSPIYAKLSAVHAAMFGE